MDTGTGLGSIMILNIGPVKQNGEDIKPRNEVVESKPPKCTGADDNGEHSQPEQSHLGASDQIGSGMPKGGVSQKWSNPKFPKESTGWVADAPGGGCRTVVTGSDRGGVRSGDGQVDGDVNIVVCPRSPYCGNEASGKFKIMWWWDNNTMQDYAILDGNL